MFGPLICHGLCGNKTSSSLTSAVALFMGVCVCDCVCVCVCAYERASRTELGGAEHAGWIKAELSQSIDHSVADPISPAGVTDQETRKPASRHRHSITLFLSQMAPLFPTYGTLGQRGTRLLPGLN